MNKGDILLIKYRFDPFGWLIRRFTHNEWNHAGWILDDSHLLEAKGRKICITHIRKYIYNINYKVKLLKIENIKKEEIKEAIEYAIRFKGRYNYFRWIWILVLIGINSKKKISRHTCSGLIADSLAQVGFYFRKDKNPLRITPSDIDTSKRVKNISGQI